MSIGMDPGLAALLARLRSMHRRSDGGAACRVCLVADGYERCPTASLIDSAQKAPDIRAPALIVAMPDSTVVA